MVIARDAVEGFAGRGGDRALGRRQWERAVEATDWTRTLHEARGLHARRVRLQRDGHSQHGDGICGPCIQAVLLAGARSLKGTT